MIGGTGDDFYYIQQPGDLAIEGEGEGNDTVLAGINYALGDNIENLRLYADGRVGLGNDLDNTIIAGIGPALLYGYGGNDTIRGTAFNDEIWGGDGNDVIDARQGNDVVVGGAGNDTVYGGLGADRLRGQDGDDVLRGDGGNDIVVGGAGNDRVFGGDGNDEVYGGNGNDFVGGGMGMDMLWGGNGADQIDGGAGADMVWGGDGADSFIFRDGDFDDIVDGNFDVIGDFSQEDGDVINLAQIDADSTNNDDDPMTNDMDDFTFIGDAEFSGTAGELRYEQSDMFTAVYGDTDGDGMADFTIVLDGQVDLVMQDFVL